VKTLITLCTYNEVENLRDLVPEIFRVAPDATILVIDDNSPDGTSDLVASMAVSEPRLQLLRRPRKVGLGAATLAGFHYGIERGFDLLINLDADFSHPPRYIPDLLKQMDRCDVAIASRYMPGGGVAGWTRGRKLMSRLINLWARMLLGLTTADNSGSFRCYRVSKLADVDWRLTIAKGYAFQEEVLYRCRKVGCRMMEVPFIFEDRRYGITKINLKESLSAVVAILAVAIQRLYRHRVRRPDA
jgi:dolichol-phosphate mannosyltransferase